MFWALMIVSLGGAAVLALHSGDALRYADEVDYVRLARNLQKGLGFVSANDLRPTAFRPPGYPFVMAPLAALDNGVVLLKLLNVAFLGVSLVLMRHLVARDTAGIAWLAGGAALAYPIWMYAASTLYPQILCMMLLLIVTVLILRSQFRWGILGVAGVVYGCLVLVAPSFLLLTPVLALHLVLRGPHDRLRNLAGGVLFCAMIGATMLPWNVRNYHVFGQLVPVSTNGGINLLLGNSEHARANSGVAVDVDRYVDQTEGLDEVAASRKLSSFALQWIKEHPAEALGLYVQKAANYYNYRAEPVTAGQGAAWKDWVMIFTYYPMVLLVLARLLYVRKLPLSRTEELLLSMYVLNGLLAAIFFTRIRFRLPYDGLLMVLAIIAVGRLVAVRQGAPLSSSSGSSPA